MEFRYLMPKWHFWVLVFVMLPIGLGGLFVDIKDPFGRVIVPYLSIFILIVWLIFFPVKAKGYFIRNHRIVLGQDAINIPTDFRGLLSIHYTEIKEINLIYRNTILWGAKITFGGQKSVRVLKDFFDDEMCFAQFLEELDRRLWPK